MEAAGIYIVSFNLISLSSYVYYPLDVEFANSTSYYVINLGCNFQGKKGVWIKLPIEHANLVEATVKVNTCFQIYYYYFTTNWLILKRRCLFIYFLTF